MVEVLIKYTGDLHCDATHGPSESKISTDAPMDNKGRGEEFSPTDLVATALGTCMTTTMGIKAQELGVDLRGMTVSVRKEMSKDGPRRIVGLPSEVRIPLHPILRIEKYWSKRRSIVRCTRVFHRKSFVPRNFSGKAEGSFRASRLPSRSFVRRLEECRNIT